MVNGKLPIRVCHSADSCWVFPEPLPEFSAVDFLRREDFPPMLDEGFGDVVFVRVDLIVHQQAVEIGRRGTELLWDSVVPVLLFSN